MFKNLSYFWDSGTLCSVASPIAELHSRIYKKSYKRNDRINQGKQSICNNSVADGRHQHVEGSPQSATLWCANPRVASCPALSYHVLQ